MLQSIGGGTHGDQGKWPELGLGQGQKQVQVRGRGSEALRQEGTGALLDREPVWSEGAGPEDVL